MLDTADIGGAGDATAVSDYTAKTSDALTVAGGATVPYTVDITSDTTCETAEDFTLTITSGAGAGATLTTATITITDDGECKLLMLMQ